MKKYIGIPFLLFFIISVNAQYYGGETANFIVDFSDYTGNPVNGICSGYIFYPNLTLYTFFPLQFDSNSGVYYHSFTVPDEEGTYLEVAKCIAFFGYKNKTLYARKTFFVSKSLEQYTEDIHNLVQNASLNITLDITGNITEGIQNASAELPKEVWKFFKTMELSGITLDDPQECINSTHLKIWTTRNVCIGTDCFIINSTEIRECPYGCNMNTNACNWDPIGSYFIVIGVIFIIGVIIWKIIA